jgi:hypothetical protein
MVSWVWTIGRGDSIDPFLKEKPDGYVNRFSI